MELRLIEYFLAVVDHGSVTDASRSLYVTQPAVSQAIRQLEQQLSVELFSRSGRRLALTEAGRSFVAPARRVAADIAAARRAVTAVSTLQAGTIDIASTPTLSVDPLPRMAGLFHRHYPDIEIRISGADAADDVATSVRSGATEVGLAELPFRSDGLRIVECGTQEILLALSHELAAALPEPLTLRDLDTVPMIVDLSVRDSSRSHVPGLDGAFGSAVIECAHRQAVWELVVRGAGATLVPADIARRELTDVAVRSLTPPIVRRLAVMVRSSAVSPAARAFMDVNSLLLPNLP
ncbi:LysR family transcriptional regulator [Rhodococcus sp. IEGM 1381]|uniref:LysR family transcriptional regulator n=1 Tax=Rhodococcus sp. IEGM 1381 TaxID=3047085 RepID=UPI0024B8084F|nr:LysR family transcriptional regulator [Rhodococcus sp. IEGM 1381]